MRRSGVLLAAVALVSGCGGSGLAPSPSSLSSVPDAVVVQSATPTTEPAASSPSPSTPGALEHAFPAEGVTIVNEGTSQFELWSPGGVRVFVDIAVPDAITATPTATDILLTTHLHEDHVSTPFADAFPGKQLFNTDGTVTSKDVHVTGIGAAHNEGDPMTGSDVTDHIFVIDIGGIRVVVFGDLGQHQLTKAQMKVIGHADVAISQLANPMSDVTAVNHVAIDQMRQVAPAVLIPTHITELDAARLAASTWPATTADVSVVLTDARLPKTTTVLFMGDTAAAYRKLFSLGTADWR